MEAQKIVNLLNDSDNENSKFATKKWYIIDSESNGNYSDHNPIKFLTKSIESSLCDYSDGYVLATGNINITGGDNNTKVAFKNCAPFEKCSAEIDGTLVDEADFINITMLMYNLIKYSDNYSDTSGSLWNLKRDEIIDNADVNNDDNAPSFKYKADLIGNAENNGTKNGVKIAVPLKYLSNFWRALEMPLINSKNEISLKWIENCILSSAGTAATFKITDVKLYEPIVTLSAEGNVKLSKLLRDGFKRSIYWNKYKVIDNILVEIADDYDEKYIRELLDSSYQGVKRIFVFAYNNTGDDNQAFVDSFKKYFFPRVKIENYNIEIDGKNVYDQPVNDSIKQYNEIRKISTGQGDDHATVCLLDFSYFEETYRLIVVELSKQKPLDADSRAIQHINFTGKIKATEANTRVIIYYILEQSKETKLEFSKGKTKAL